MPEEVMMKLMKLKQVFDNEVKKLLTENIIDLYSYSWDLAYPNGKQTQVFFANKLDVEHQISLLDLEQPKYIKEVYEGHAFSAFAKEVIAQIEHLAGDINVN